jgi:type VI secretion system secreted protein Hcp
MAAANADLFIKIPGIPGEVGDTKHKDEIALQHFGLAMHSPGDLGSGVTSGVTGKVQYQPVQLTALTHKGSALLMCAMRDNKVFDGVVVSADEGNGKSRVTYLTITLDKVRITNHSINAGGHGGIRSSNDSFTLNYGKIKVEYQQHGEDGKKVGGPVTFEENLQAR